MCHLSPTVHLAWAVLACGLQIFLIQHLWRYDRFKCIAWSSGRQPGTFKRVMTYSYLTSVPAIVVYSVSMAVLKYRNGYTFIPGFGITPTPYQLWSHEDRAWLFPMQIVFSVAWGLELVTHLEELAFWFFLLHQGPNRRVWFSSIEFKAWAVSSSAAITGLPITAIVTRADPLKSEAYLFLVGGSASICVTFLFFIVLAKFPAFLRRVQREGAAGLVILRLVKFHELNILRVVFRLLMTAPFIVLGADGVRSHHQINTNMLWTDLLAFFAAVGTIVSSTLTLLIFFPRSLAKDSIWLPRVISRQPRRSLYPGGIERNGESGTTLNAKTTSVESSDYDSNGSPFSHPQDAKSKYTYYNNYFTAPNGLTTTCYSPTFVADSEARLNYELRSIEEGDGTDDKTHHWGISESDTALDNIVTRGDTLADDTGDQQLSKNENRYGANQTTKDAAQLKVRMMKLAEAVDAGLKSSSKPKGLHPYITSFTSPIDLLQYSDGDIPRAI